MAHWHCAGVWLVSVGLQCGACSSSEGADYVTNHVTRPSTHPPTRWHVHHQHIQPPPSGAYHHLIHRLGGHGAAPDDGGVTLVVGVGVGWAGVGFGVGGWGGLLEGCDNLQSASPIKSRQHLKPAPQPTTSAHLCEEPHGHDLDVVVLSRHHQPLCWSVGSLIR